ncbi:MAG: hypothetical protein M1814_004418 [Vezdaea aestivalis]|nr:MAG: hypothetical protein M1814_004418 [Vezdaea aestivalis]
MAIFHVLRRSVLRVSARPLQSSSRRFISLNSYVVTPAQLETVLAKNPRTKLSTSPRVIPLCASWFMPNDPESRTGQAVYEQGHIPSARFFDLDAVTDTSSPYPHMLPSPEVFADAVGKLGIKKDDEVVVYDSKELGIFSAPRVGWTFKVFGHSNVHVLNNYKLWVEEGRAVESGPEQKVEEVQYPVPHLDASKVIGFADVKEIAKDNGKEGAEGVQVLDARPYGRWSGDDPEPRQGLSSGHIPGSFSVPFSELLDPKNKTILPREELVKIFTSRGLDPSLPFVSSCGSGVTAAVVDAALHLAEFGQADARRLYDGSWTEWAQRVTEADGLIRKGK